MFLLCMRARVYSTYRFRCFVCAYQILLFYLQGALMRKILYATERVNASSNETVYFIAVLVVFAIAASAAVLYYGLQDNDR